MTTYDGACAPMVCNDRACLPAARQTTPKPNPTRFGRLLASLGEFARTAVHSPRDPEPVFSNGGTRVLIRPDRIDLV